jgi:hypothetical protein
VPEVLPSSWNKSHQGVGVPERRQQCESTSILGELDSGLAPNRVRGIVLFNTTAESATSFDRAKNTLLTRMLAIGALDKVVDRMIVSLQLGPLRVFDYGRSVGVTATPHASSNPLMVFIGGPLVGYLNSSDRLPDPFCVSAS